MKKMKIASLTFAALVGVSTTAQASHVLGYQFNETGTMALADGGASDASGNPAIHFTTNGGAAADLHGAPGSGVSGLPGDRAFDNTASSGIFGASHGQHATDFDPIDGFSAFTLAGWFKLPSSANESIGRQDALIENGTISVQDDPAGFRLRGGARADSGTLELRVNRDFSIESSAAYAEIGEYVNFAVTYDGTASTDNVQFYKGTVSQPLMLVDTLSLDAGAVNPELIPLTLGVTQTSGLTLNPFNGLLDNIRIWDFVLPQTSLESLRRVDAAIPEPSSLLLAFASALSLGTFRQRC